MGWFELLMVFKFVFELSSAHLELKEVGLGKSRSGCGSLAAYEEGRVS